MISKEQQDLLRRELSPIIVGFDNAVYVWARIVDVLESLTAEDVVIESNQPWKIPDLHITAEDELQSGDPCPECGNENCYLSCTAED